ncbi:MAG: beta-L-arabinofuranosidase domain-containing protein [bacterium]
MNETSRMNCRPTSSATPVYSAFEEVALRSITPEGWLRVWLERQATGLTGHIEAAGYPFDTKGWGTQRLITKGKIIWWPYEQIAYWIDGALRCAHLLRDEALLRKPLDQIEFVLRHQAKDGFLGINALRPREKENQWPHVILFRALMAHAGVTGERRFVEVIRRYYLSGTADYSHGREICHLEPMLWAWRQTGDRRLLRLAMKAYRDYNRRQSASDTAQRQLLSVKRATDHGVNYNEIGKLGALIHAHTGDRRALAAAVNAYRKMDRDQMLISGIPSSSERLRGKDPLDSHEVCDIADYTWGAGHLLLATGRAEYADKIERACLNAAPGAVTKDFKALQYFSCPNQVLATDKSNHNDYHRGWKWMSFRPNPGTECCPGNVNRILPNYAARMWLRDHDGGVVAALYGASRLTFQVGKPVREVTLVEETEFPFSEHIEFQVRSNGPATFSLRLRIPGWCRKAVIALNGRDLRLRCRPGTFAELRRTFEPNDRITLTLPMELKLSRWPRGGIGVEHGPLVYALPIREHRVIDRAEKNQTCDLPAWNLTPASPWNYALAVDERSLEERVSVVRRPATGFPWDAGTTPCLLHVPARRVSGWKIERPRTVKVHYWAPNGGVRDETEHGRYAFTPQLLAPQDLTGRLGKRLETVTLVPYGCTQLRLAVFPVCAQ